MVAKRQSYSASKKIETVLIYDETGSYTEAQSRTGISESVIRRWVKKRATIFTASDLSRKRFGRSGRFVCSPEMEKELVSRIISVRNRRLNVQYKTIVLWAKEISSRLGLKNFKASLSYVQKLCRRNGFSYRTRHIKPNQTTGPFSNNV
ncbi:unnamed protein product [Sphagnum jensenii]|uniref:Transposase n=1 Tax=Sphagnum jensenii TaxID=128206 RepID=A0ABP0VBE1_9BRYO